MKKKTERLRANLSFNIIGAIVLVLVLFGVLVSFLGFASFTEAFKREYETTTYHMADTATTLVNGDHLKAYLAGEETEEYQRSKRNLNLYCKKINVSLVYVIDVDTSDYGSFVSVFNSVNNEVDDSSYTEWELGHKRSTTNDEYQRKYRAIYEQGSACETVYRLKPGDGAHPHITTMVPVKDSAGEVRAILCIQRPAREIREARRPYLRNIALSTILLALVSSTVAALFIRKQFVVPIQKVSDEATRFAKENTKGEPLGEISKFKEFARLAHSIDTMETDMVSYVENLTTFTADRERIVTELSLAGKIQEASIPNEFPAFPDREEFDIFCTMDPAREVGGDFYNFYFVDDDHLALVIGWSPTSLSATGRAWEETRRRSCASSTRRSALTTRSRCSSRSGWGSWSFPRESSSPPTRGTNIRPSGTRTAPLNCSGTSTASSSAAWRA